MTLCDYVLIRLLDAANSHEAVLILVWHEHRLLVLLLTAGFEVVRLSTHHAHDVLLVLNLRARHRRLVLLVVHTLLEVAMHTTSCHRGRHTMI